MTTTTHRLPAAAATGVVVGTPGYRRLVVALMAGGLANFSLLYFVQPLLPVLADHYDVTPAESAHALSATTAVMVIGLLAMGAVTDRIGRVAMMRWSLLLAGVLGVASAFAPTWGTLVAARALLGPVLAGFPVAALAYLRDEVAAGSHLRANASYIAGTAVGGAVGRLLPGPLAALGGWPVAAGVMAGITLGAGLALWLLLPPERVFVRRTEGLGRSLGGTLAAPRDPVVAILCVTAFVGNGTFVAAFNAIGFRLAAPPLALGGAAALVYFAYPTGILAPGVARRLTERLGRGRASAVGFAALAVSVLALSSGDLAGIVIGLGGLAFAFLGTHSLLSGWVVDRAKRTGGGTAQASSAYLLSFYLGSTLAGALATVLWQSSGWQGVEALCLGLVAVGVAAVLTATRLDRDAGVVAVEAIG